MPLEMKHRLNPIYETVFLLYYGYDLDKFKSTVISQMNESDYKGEEIYQKHFKIIDKYIASFQKYRVTGDKDRFYFQDTSRDFYTSFVMPLFAEKELMDHIAELDNEAVFKILLHTGKEIFEQDISEFEGLSHTEFTKTDVLMSFIHKFDLSEHEKWKMLLILQKPQEYYRDFSEIVKKNIPAFEKSAEVMRSALSKTLTNYEKAFEAEKAGNQLLKEFNLSNCDINIITPALVTANNIVVFLDTCYYGLLAEKAIKELGYDNGKEYLKICLKALSDSSKLEILSTLKTSPKYAAELAVQLGLTPATVSHHMNMLLSARLVYVEKSDGKYYYHLNKDSIHEILEQLNSMLTV